MEIRQLEEGDYDLGYLDLLAGLTTVGAITKEEWANRFKQINTQSMVEIWVIEYSLTNQIIGTGTLLFEPKFIHECGLVAHIEDIVVSKNTHGTGMGKKIVTFLAERAKIRGCYKVILDSTQNTIGFYQKCGFIVKGTQMAVYF